MESGSAVAEWPTPAGASQNRQPSPDRVCARIERLLAEADRLLGSDPPRMERLAVEALELAEALPDPFLAAMARMKQADAARIQGQHVHACELYDEARTGFTTLGRPIEAARTRIGWVLSTAQRGQLREALGAVQVARAVFLAHGELLRAAGLELNTGNIYLEHGQYRSALRLYSRAMMHFETVGAPGRLGMLRCRANRGIVLARLGRHQDALKDLHEASVGYRACGEKAGLARVLQVIASTQVEIGRYSQSLHTFEELRPLLSALGLHTELIVLACDIATCYLHLGRPTDALAALDKSETELWRHESPQDAFSIASRHVAALLMMGRDVEALDVLDRTEQQLSVGAPHHRAWLVAQRADVQLRDGRLADALTSARRACDLARGSGLRRLRADALVTEGAALLAIGDAQAARQAAMRALRLARAVGAWSLLYRVHELLGQIAEASGDPAAARRHYRAAIKHLEWESQSVTDLFRDSFLAERGVAYERLALLLLAANRPLEAFTVVEQAKSYTLARAVARADGGRPRVLPAPARAIARELAEARGDYARLMARNGGGETATSDADLMVVEERVLSLMHRFEVATARALPPVRGNALPALPPDTALVQFFVAGDDTARFLITGGTVRGEVLTGATAETERLLRVVQMELNGGVAGDGPRAEPSPRLQAALTRLHTRLLGGLDLTPAASLIVVPHGILHYLPFHALHDGTSYLVERHALVTAPSAAIYAASRREITPRRRHRPLVLAHSAGGRLPGTLSEGEAVARLLAVPLLAEAEATRAVVERDGQRASLIHLAAHGWFRPDQPLFSSVELADGALTAADVYGMRLRAGLVTLSACETGRMVAGGGDQLAGLAHSFLHAGAAAVLVSGWRVDDVATAALMERFYRALKAGATPAAALREAQLSLLQGTKKTHAHPFYWAGFGIVGGGGPVVRTLRSRADGRRGR